MKNKIISDLEYKLETINISSNKSLVKRLKADNQQTLTKLAKIEEEVIPYHEELKKQFIAENNKLKTELTKLASENVYLSYILYLE